MGHFKRKRPKHQRAGCLMCKPFKDERGKNGFEAQSRQEKRARVAEKIGDGGSYDEVPVFILELTETEMTLVSEEGVETHFRWNIGDESRLEELALHTGLVEVLLPNKREPRARQDRKKKHKPYVVEIRWLTLWMRGGGWRIWKRYARQSDRDQALAALQRKDSSSREYRAGMRPG